MKSNNALIVILGTVTLDAVGIGLVMPVLPGLLRDIVHSDSIASHYGVLLALLAALAAFPPTRRVGARVQPRRACLGRSFSPAHPSGVAADRTRRGRGRVQGTHPLPP